LLSTPQTHIFTHAKGYKYTDYYIARPCKANNETVSLQQKSQIIFMKKNIFLHEKKDLFSRK